MKTLFFLLLLAIPIFSQKVCLHPDEISAFDNVAVLPPNSLKIISFNGATLSYVIISGKEVRGGDLRLKPETVVDKDFSKFFKQKKWWIIYCKEHNTIYRIDAYILDK